MNHSVSTMSGKTKVKVVFLGNQAVGKSSIIEKYIHDRFDENSNSTVGIDFLAKNVSHGGKNYRMQLWDTAGQERFRSLIPSYLKDAHCALITFDVTSARSLEQASTWLSLYNENRTGDGRSFLVANKIDLQHREVSTQSGKSKAKEFGIEYFEISAKTGENLQELFMTILDASTQVITGSTRTLQNQQNRIPAAIKEIKEQIDDDTQVTKGKEEIEGAIQKAKKQANQVDKSQSNANIGEKGEPVHNRGINLKTSDKDSKKDKGNMQNGCC